MIAMQDVFSDHLRSKGTTQVKGRMVLDRSYYTMIKYDKYT